MGTYVTDDPASLRYAAGQLRQRAEVFLDIASQVDATVPTMVYVGSAGDTYRASVSETSGRLRTTCAGINDVADRLLREADRVEQEQAAQAAQAAGNAYDVGAGSWLNGMDSGTGSTFDVPDTGAWLNDII